MLLTGTQPFEGKDYATIIKQNKLATINYDKLEGKSSYKDALLLLKKMLVANPHDRPTATECLKFDYITKVPETEEEIAIQLQALSFY